MGNFDTAALERLRFAIGSTELTPAELKTLEWLAGWEDSTIKNICAIIYKVRDEERRQALSRDKLTRKDLLTVWGYLDVLSGFYNAKAKTLAAKNNDSSDKLTADYTRRVAEITSIQRKIDREAGDE